MRIDIWSDYACPFCYIGKRKLEKALEEFKGKEDIEIVWRSFQLDPNAKDSTDIDMVSGLARKYNMSIEKSQEMINHMDNMAKEVGLNYNFKDMIQTNTLKAHRLAIYAKEFGLMGEMNERLLKAHFIDGINIGDIEILGDLAKEVGLNRDDTLTMLNSDEYIDQVEADRYEAKQLDINSVPFFIFNNKYGVQGAQPTPVFIDTLEKAILDGN